MAQRVVQYQAVLQMAQQAPQIYDLPQLHRQMIEVLGIKNADKLVPTAEDQKPKDPVAENMAALSGKPMRAFIYQDHQAHITVHQTFMQDPVIAATIGQNPQAQQIMAALQAHIAEHTGFLYRKQLEEQLGVTLPPPNEELPEDIEYELSKLMAEAGKQLQQVHQAEQAQQQAQQAAQDPILQLRQQELQIKQADIQRKAQKDQADVQLEQERLEIEKVKATAQFQKDTAQLDNINRQADKRIDLDLLREMIKAKTAQLPKGNK
jgi:hypothetical protein